MDNQTGQAMANGRLKVRLFSSVVLLGLAAGLSLRAQTSAAPADLPPKRLNHMEIRSLVDRYADLYKIPDQSAAIVRVIHMESSGFATVKSPSGRYYGLCQFMPRTFKAYVEIMKKSGLLEAGATYSPFNPEHAIQVMVWMWSQGEQLQWGPARRILKAQARPVQGPPLPDPSFQTAEKLP